MACSELTIKNYCCFTDEQTLVFAQPNGELGSGITYIVGENNVGKTALIEALFLNKHLEIPKESARQPNSETEITIKTNDNKEYKFSADGYLMREETANNGVFGLKFELLPLNREWDCRTIPPGVLAFNKENNKQDQAKKLRAQEINFKEDPNVRLNHNGNMISGKILSRTEVVEDASFLTEINKDSKKKDVLTKLMQRCMPNFTDWFVSFTEDDGNRRTHIEYKTGKGEIHPANKLGAGILSLFKICASLIGKENTVLIIEEPELFLHPSAQKNLIKVIAEFSKERQIILSTHSPYFVSWKYIEQGAKLNRVSKKLDKNSKIHTLGDATKYSSFISGGNWQQPFLMDEVAKEVFFANENILFLEGQEDVGLLKKEFKDNVNLFGYGVRGRDNFETALTMAHDLGFEKVGVILDGGEEESKIYKDLKENFKQYNYKILQWKRSDIRDKPAHESKEKKEGYFSKHGKKKTDNLGDFEEKIGELNSYFNSTD